MQSYFKSPKSWGTPTCTAPATAPWAKPPWQPGGRRSLESSIATAGEVKGTLESMRDIPSAYWLDNKGNSAERNNFRCERIADSRKVKQLSP